MEIEVPGNTIQVQITPLGDQMDSCIKRLFTKFFSNPQLPYPEFMKACYQDLRANMHSYFDSKIENPPGHDYLFNNLTIIWNNYQINGRYGEAQQFWNDILDIVIEWETSRGQRIHKGSLFFFWSQTAILQGQFDKGFLLIHSSYEEDVLTHQNENPGAPSYKTVALDYADNANFLFGLVKAWADYLASFIAKYPNPSANVFTLDDFRKKFLTNPPSRDTLFSFTYTLARFYEFDSIPSMILRGNFASLFELNSLFDLVLVTDAVIYSSIKNPGRDDWKFINLANRILVKSGLSPNQRLNETHLSHINSIKNINFDRTIDELLDQTLVYPDNISPSRLECDISIAYCIRNHSAHKVDSFPVIRNRFKEIRQSIFNALFLATETL